MKSPLGNRTKHSGDLSLGWQLQKRGYRHVYSVLPGRYWQFETDRRERVGEMSGFPNVWGGLLSAPQHVLKLEA